MNRITKRFRELSEKKEKGFVAYIGAGDPHLEATRSLAVAFDQAGVDILELGVPFSDPLADGLVNQMAAQRALQAGVTPPQVLSTVSEIRRDSEIPVVLYVYYNVIHRWGPRRFVEEAARSGVDGILVLDLPPEEAADYEALMRGQGLCLIFLVAPTTPPERMELIARHATGFIYYVSREGVTGMQQTVADSIGSMTSRIRKFTELPIAVGFGISTPDQAMEVAQSAEAVVVGSAIVHRIGEIGDQPDLVPRVTELVQWLLSPLKAKVEKTQ